MIKNAISLLLNKYKEENIESWSLHLKILLCHFIAVTVAVCMICILLYEHQHRDKLEADMVNLRNIQYDIYTTHNYIAGLAFLGETVISWDEQDYLDYHTKRVCTDSLLLSLRSVCRGFIPVEQIDTLRVMLREKEERLWHIMKTLCKQGDEDSLLIIRFPAALKQATNFKEFVQKKKGIAGLFGGKRTV